MLLSFRKDKAFINILSDLEVFLSEAADKLDIDTKSLSTFTTVDNTRKYRNWNRIESVDTSNYIKFYRYDYNLQETDGALMPLPWRDYDESKDLSVLVFLDRKLVNPQLYSIHPSDIPTINTDPDKKSYAGVTGNAGYMIDFTSYAKAAGNAIGNVTILRTTTALPVNIKAVDLAIDQWVGSGTGAQNIAYPWGSVSDNDLFIQVYVGGELYTEDNTNYNDKENNRYTYRLFNNAILFSRVVNVGETIIVIRHRKVTTDEGSNP